MTQWIECQTKFSGSNTLSRLDLVFMSDDQAVEEIKYECPLGRSNHVLIGISMCKDLVVGDEEYRMLRYRYNKANFGEIRKYFEEAD